MRRGILAALAALVLLLAGCGSSNPHVWTGPPNGKFASLGDTYAVTLLWAGVTVPSATGFYVKLDGSQQADVGSTVNSYRFSGLSCSTTYTLGVQAHDADVGVSPTYTTSYTSPDCVGGSAPVNQVAPYFCGSISPSVASNSGGTGDCSSLTGDAVSGDTLTVGTGQWTNSPTSFSYQWQDCAETAGQPAIVGSCSDISGATSSSYTVQASDVGSALVPIVTATNGSGSTSTSVSGSCDSGSTYGGQGGTLTGTVNADPVEPVGCSPISAVAGTTTGTGSGAMTFCTNAPVTCGLPDPVSGNVGVPPGTTLTPGTISCSSGTVSGVYSTTGASISGTCTVTDSRITRTSNTSSAAISISGTATLSHSEVSGLYAGASDVTTGTGEIANVNAACDFATSGQAYDILNAGSATVSDVYLHCAQEPQNGTVSASDSYEISDEQVNGSHNEAFYFPNGTNGITETNDVFLMPWNQTAGVFGDSNFQTTSKNASNVHFEGGLVASAGSNGAIGLAQTETTEGSGNQLDNFRYSYINSATMSCGWARGPSMASYSGNIRDDTAVSMGTQC